jgi:hypothetical protein
MCFCFSLLVCGQVGAIHSHCLLSGMPQGTYGTENRQRQVSPWEYRIARVCRFLFTFHITWRANGKLF